MQTINAENQTLGRVASKAAFILLGKHTTDFAKHIVAGEAVTITNASKVRVSGAKAKQKVYTRYSGYPGGQKHVTYAMLVERKGQKEAIRKAVYGMLPGNRLRAQRMKLLTIEG